MLVVGRLWPCDVDDYGDDDDHCNDDDDQHGATGGADGQEEVLRKRGLKAGYCAANIFYMDIGQYDFHLKIISYQETSQLLQKLSLSKFSATLMPRAQFFRYQIFTEAFPLTTVWDLSPKLEFFFKTKSYFCIPGFSFRELNDSEGVKNDVVRNLGQILHLKRKL